MSRGVDDLNTLREVRGRFDDPKRMQDAVDKLALSGFDRADLTLPSEDEAMGRKTPESTSKPASTEADARQARTLGGSTAAAAAALAAAGVTVATGGAAAPAVAAAILAGGAAGGATFAVTDASTTAEQREREAQAASDRLVLSVRVVNAAKQSQATAVLRAAGATSIDTFEYEAD